MMLQDPKEGGQVQRPVVDDLGLRAHLAAQEDAAHANEHLGIDMMGNGLDPFDQAPGEVLLAADIGGDRLGLGGGPHRVFMGKLHSGLHGFMFSICSLAGNGGVDPDSDPVGAMADNRTAGSG